MKITATQPAGDSLVASIYENPDYLDCFVAAVGPDTFERVDDVATAWFMGQPAWLRLLSTNTLSKGAVEDAIARGYRVGDTVGSWEIITRNDEEIVFGENMGFMQYRMSFRLPSAGDRIEAGTAVRFLWHRTGKFYFALVQPLHPRFVKMVLKNTIARSNTRPPKTPSDTCE